MNPENKLPEQQATVKHYTHEDLASFGAYMVSKERTDRIKAAYEPEKDNWTLEERLANIYQLDVDTWLEKENGFFKGQNVMMEGKIFELEMKLNQLRAEKERLREALKAARELNEERINPDYAYNRRECRELIDAVLGIEANL